MNIAQRFIASIILSGNSTAKHLNRAKFKEINL